jgi:hypothetical protein
VVKAGAVLAGFTACLALAWGGLAYAQVPVEDAIGMYEIAYADANAAGGEVWLSASRTNGQGLFLLSLRRSRCDGATGERKVVYGDNYAQLPLQLVWFDPFMREGWTRGRALLNGYMTTYASCTLGAPEVSTTSFADVPVQVAANWTSTGGHHAGPVLTGTDPLSCMMVGYRIDQGPDPWWSNTAATVALEGSLPDAWDLGGTHQAFAAGMTRSTEVAVKTGTNGDCVS